ncbi:MAG: precorrin-2 dehydrogenase/sirohydrochlorin ferrochelatase family protein [Actinomycetota bacterium]
MAFGYPIALDLDGRRAVVIGEEAVRHGKVEGLLAAGASVLVVAKGPGDRLSRLEADDRVVVARRGFEPSDLDEAAVCVASSHDPAERAAIATAARRCGVLVNVMDDNRNCDFAAPAIARRGDLAIAISTGGRSPALARRLRIELEERFGTEWGELVDIIGRVREETLAGIPDIEERAKMWDEALGPDELTKLADLVRSGRPKDAELHLRARLSLREALTPRTEASAR